MNRVSCCEVLKAMIDNIPCFLAKHNISQEDFEKTGLCWQELNQIFNDYVTKKRTFEEHARNITNLINEGLSESIHSTKFRIKDPDHLIAKIIRKKLSAPKRSITLQNYETEVTDLIGIRILHLFKDDWQAVHEFIIRNWKLKEKFTANVRQGDNTDNFKKRKAKINIHKAGYRSVHYLIKHPIPNNKIIAEVQVRTIFEEAWSEIDHKIRYPDNLDNTILSEFLVVFNRLAGSADEMGTFLTNLVHMTAEIEQKYKTELIKRDKEIEALHENIAKMNLTDSQKRELTESVAKISGTTINCFDSSEVAQAPISLSRQALSNIATATATVQMLMPLKCHMKQTEEEREVLDISSAYQLHLKTQTSNSMKK